MELLPPRPACLCDPGSPDRVRLTACCAVETFAVCSSHEGELPDLSETNRIRDAR